MQITLVHLQQVGIRPHVQEDLRELYNSYSKTYEVDSLLRIAHFMAQVCHECDGFRINEENLNYKTPERLMKIWPKRFPSIEFASQYINNPEKLGNYVYSNRLGNGSGESGDGFRYRGRGPLQTTGKEWYASLSLKMFGDNRLVEDPDLLKDLKNGLLAAFLEWNEGKCNALADKDDIKRITLKINGSTIGLEKRTAWLMKWKTTLQNNPELLSNLKTDNMTTSDGN